MESQDKETRPAVIVQQPCGQCGAKLDFAPGTSVLKCPYCGFEMQIQKSEKQVAELDYVSFLEKAGQEKASYEQQRVKCDKCGAEVSGSPRVARGRARARWTR